jgi:D-aspartate ligase
VVPVIILSSHTAGLGVIRSLGSRGIPVVSVYYNKRDMGYVSKYVENSVFAPHPEQHEEKFIGLLLEMSRTRRGAILIPADDATLSVVSRHKKVLDDHYLVACTGWDITERIIDKKFSYELAESIGVPAPRTVMPKSAEDLRRSSASLNYPCLVKPCESHLYFEVFKRKMVKVDSFEELARAYRQAADAGLQVMLQEYIPGDDTRGVNYNSYFWDGEPLVEFTAEKVRLSPAGFGVPSVVVSKEIPEVIESGRKILKALGYHGYSCTEFKKDPRDGIYKFMEVNGRYNRSALLALECGINFPLMEYRHLVEREKPAAVPFRHGVYWIDEFRDADRFFGECGRRSFPLLRYLRPYLTRHVFAVFNTRDPIPFLKRSVDALKEIVRRALRREGRAKECRNLPSPPLSVPVGGTGHKHSVDAAKRRRQSIGIII